MRAAARLTLVLQSLVRDMRLPWPEKAVLEAPKDPAHGDLASNLALVLAKETRCSPRETAARLADALKSASPGISAGFLPSDIASVEVAGPGFLNVRFSPAFQQRRISEIETRGPLYGSSDIGRGRKTLLEYVSANPTGPLHIGHGRGAAVGDSLARILRFAGFDVRTEYYVNDAGRQMSLLGRSILLRAREAANLPVNLPEEYYKGTYIADTAAGLLRERPDLHELPEEEAETLCREYGAREILRGIREDLARFRVEHQNWFSEQTLVQNGAVERAFGRLREKSLVFERDGALWFASARLGDDKDRVLCKSDGSLTYFASDIAYHDDKYKRGFDFVIDIWGADHHGYAPRIRAAVEALGRKAEDFEILFIQLVNLLRNGTPVGMSTRAGTFETLADVVAEVGVDAARFMFLSRKCDSPLDFDLEAVKERSMENPVYYVQYAHARVCALLRRGEQEGLRLPDVVPPALLAPLQNPEDLALLRLADRFEDVAAAAALKLAPHHISAYLTELSGLLHSYYAKYPVLRAEDGASGRARLALLRALGQVLRNGLDLLGVTAPDSM
jgi:arginyl-tRNA synthetase